MNDPAAAKISITYDSVQWIFLRVLALVYVIAFASFGFQAAGLIGSHGIQPVNLYLARIFEAAGSSGYRLAPTLLWLSSTDTAITALCVAGALCAVLAFTGVLWRAALALAFVLYLSLVNASQEFLSYQWDFLLLETGFLAIFLGYSPIVVWLLRWLLFRLMFFSGVVKLTSGDATWHNLTALTFHYWTQPIPTPLAWYANQMPLWFQQASCAGVFLIELFIPFLILGPRRSRLFALPWLLGLQGLIMLTGNYAFFNILAMSLCLFLVDDAMFTRILAGKWMARRERPRQSVIPLRARRPIAWSLAIIVGVLSGLLALQSLGVRVMPPATTLLSAAAPFGIVNSYGLFANMTTTRPEIVVEGSNDGTNWRTYQFRYKAGPLNRRPPWVAPHQPRLDWQMWFAALGSYRENVWFLNFLARLLQGRPEVLTLLESNPFPDQPPKLVRAQVFAYRFTDRSTRLRTGDWWTLTPAGLYLRPVSLENLAGLPVLANRDRRE